MKITHQSSNRLVICHQPLYAWLQTGLLIIIGVIWLFNPPGAIWLGALGGLICFAVAIAFLLWQGDRVINLFDKQKGQFKQIRQGLRGNKIMTCALRDISSIAVEERERMNRNRSWSQNRYYYKIYVQLYSNQRLCLSAEGSGDRQRIQDVAWEICNFLDLGPYSFTESRSRQNGFRLW